MKPIGPLMWEHRLIERLLKLCEGQIIKIRQENNIDPVFIDTAVDFIRIYADRTHHGKEEDILFRDLGKKKLSAEHARIMNELVEEHKYARTVVGKLVEAKEKILKGNKAVVKDIIACLKELSDFYPKHIEKEDKHFFFPLLEYFSREEQDAMLNEFWEFDRNMIHEKYTKLVYTLEQTMNK
ncbi:MAG TPA: hemerythrin domain-containing protein [Syntrophorhabdus sp.]|nr:hemerythrin domain-containing protein [Syntrophorhabdus sp.]